MPVRNEQDIIEDVVEEWHTEVMQYLPPTSELIFDDGASTDGTLAKLEALQRKYTYIQILYSQRDGFAKSARRLYTQARCPLVFFTDSDGQYIASEFWKIAPHMDHADLIHGAKMIRRDPFFRLISSEIFNFIARRKFGT
jgi:glycosyltransferase involved in cell wall biosynthesis